jgi:tartronate-semialdehyde synthase
MAKMRAIDAAVRILEKEGVTIAFGVPGAAINPLYSALKKRGSIGHILARHVTPAPRPAISASASAHQVRPAPT